MDRNIYVLKTIETSRDGMKCGKNCPYSIRYHYCELFQCFIKDGNRHVLCVHSEEIYNNNPEKE